MMDTRYAMKLIARSDKCFFLTRILPCACLLYSSSILAQDENSSHDFSSLSGDISQTLEIDHSEWLTANGELPENIPNSCSEEPCAPTENAQTVACEKQETCCEQGKEPCCISPIAYGETGYCDCNPADGYGFMEATDPCGCCRRYGIWMPECPVLFKPFMADPRQLVYSAGWRFDDWVFVKNVIDVSFFDSFPIYRLCNVFFCGDAIQADFEGCLWAIFDPLHDSSPLINADYYGGGNISYRCGPFSARLRVFHISSHIGDEFLLNHPFFCRLNPSAEYLDLCLSYQITPQLRIYAGLGAILQRDISFPFKRFYMEWGTEAYFPFWQFYSISDSLSGAPFFAMHFRSREDNNFHHDATYVLGYEFAKHSGLCRKLRFFVEYHQGYSVEGQFSRYKTNYLALRATYGF